LAELRHIAIDNDAPMSRSDQIVTFETWFLQYEPLIRNYLWRVIGEEQTAYDLTQDTFLRAWREFPKIRQYANPRAWLLHVATNLALTQRTRRAAPVGAAVPLDTINDPSSSDPARRVVESELVRHALHMLTPRARALLVLREVYGFEINDVAGILSMSRNAVKMALCRAREQFRVIYEQEEGE
jgi:RNA polymerase sigma-70 factor (ECF subfamily)